MKLACIELEKSHSRVSDSTIKTASYLDKLKEPKLELAPQVHEFDSASQFQSLQRKLKSSQQAVKIVTNEYQQLRRQIQQDKLLVENEKLKDNEKVQKLKQSIQALNVTLTISSKQIQDLTEENKILREKIVKIEKMNEAVMIENIKLKNGFMEPTPAGAFKSKLLLYTHAK
jgi:hypothetical protein